MLRSPELSLTGIQTLRGFSMPSTVTKTLLQVWDLVRAADRGELSAIERAELRAHCDTLQHLSSLNDSTRLSLETLRREVCESGLLEQGLTPDPRRILDQIQALLFRIDDET